ncbi:hypothetical protein CEUSTIGMA_g7857.t1 [Chlamydomonas eustigma]|uniref:Uncharacterized protein n=1 Tax=Chlamydomonas eustigma TaxID=1157962 RepID=A0A250XBG4_9CHLO|nr:hypothetical protein CEUSTIGMA_g7857.t1 [Chlamydomonas eustigma]|eukprot:GAX80418.1 hypothetical protein CEUSTIGMA_g7857.t1 [Chlamydomonas eustigma]
MLSITNERDAEDFKPRYELKDSSADEKMGLLRGDADSLSATSAESKHHSLRAQAPVHDRIPLFAFFLLPVSLHARRSAHYAGFLEVTAHLRVPMHWCSMGMEANGPMHHTDAGPMRHTDAGPMRHTDELEERRRVLANYPLLLGSGLCLALHFGGWVWGLQHTSMTHAILFCSSSPLLIAAWALVTRKPITKTEVGGTLLGLMGGLLLASTSTEAALQGSGETSTADSPPGISPAPVAGIPSWPLMPNTLSPADIADSSTGAGRQLQPHIAGDMVELLAAAAFVGYLEVGRKLRVWMPTFVYASIVTGISALVLTLVAAMTELRAAEAAGIRGTVIGWMFKGRYAVCILYLAAVPGILGHTNFNALLKYFTPLTLTLAMQMEPLVGSLMGWMAGFVSAPNWRTYLGGAAVLVAAGVVTVASSKREEKQEGLITTVNGLGRGNIMLKSKPSDVEMMGPVCVQLRHADDILIGDK